MAAKWVNFSISTTGDKSVTGVGFQPNLVIIFATGNSSADAIGGHFIIAVGAATGLNGSETGAFSSYVIDNLSTGQAKCRTESDEIIHINFNSSILQEANLKSFDADGFTLNVTTCDTGRVCTALCLDTDDATVKVFMSRTSTGSQSLTGAGFEPDGLIIFGAGQPSLAFLDSGAITHFGAASGTGATEEFCVSTWHDDTANPTSTGRYHDTNALYAPAYTGLNTFIDANLSSFDADGATLNYSTANANDRPFIAVFLKGQCHVTNTFDFNTSTGAQSGSDVAFAPEAVVFASNSGTSSNASVTHAVISVGGTDGDDEGSISGTSESGISNSSDCYARTDTNSIIHSIGLTGSIDLEASASTLTANGWSFTVATAKAGPVKGSYFAYAKTPAIVPGHAHSKISRARLHSKIGGGLAA